MAETILDRIVAEKRREIDRQFAGVSLAELEKQAAEGPPIRDFFAALAEPAGVALIAEVKKASPSAGIIREDFDPAEIATAYAESGAACISVLTDEPFFQGKLEYLSAVRAAVEIPVLRKDFLIDSRQLYQARIAGADAVLLIAECLDDCNLRKLHNETIDLGMTPLVEYYELSNRQRVLDAGATLVGVNNRNLHTFEVDIQHTLRQKELLPEQCILVAESGIHTHEQVKHLAEAGVDAMLVGESLMRQPDIRGAVRTLLGQG